MRLRQTLENQVVQAEVKAGLVNLTRAVAHDVNNAIGSLLPLAEQVREELASGRFDARVLGEDLDVIVEKARLCKRIYKALYMNGYARMDLRMTAEGRVYVLEANPNPNLSYGEDLAESAHAAGIKYEELIQKILNLGLRHRAAWQE